MAQEHHEHEVVTTTQPVATVPTTRHTEVVTDPAPAEVDQVHTTAYDPYAARRHSAWKLQQLVWLVFGLIEAMLAIRFVLKLLGANPNADFAAFMYGITAPLVAPFVGLFGTPGAGGSVLELHTLVAMVIYALVGWLIAKLVWLALGETRSAVTTSSSAVETRARH